MRWGTKFIKDWRVPSNLWEVQRKLSQSTMESEANCSPSTVPIFSLLVPSNLTLNGPEASGRASPVVIYLRHCPALPIQSGFVLPEHLQSQYPQTVPDLYFREQYLTTCMSKRTLLLVSSISQRLLANILSHPLYSVFRTDTTDISLIKAPKHVQ